MNTIYVLSTEANREFFVEFCANIPGYTCEIHTDYTDFAAQMASYRPRFALLDSEAPQCTRLTLEILRSEGVSTILGGLWPQHSGARELPFDACIDLLADGSAGLQRELARWLPPSEAEVAPSQPGEIVVFWGPQGSPGRTSLVLAASAVLGQENNVLCVDADSMAPAFAQFLGLGIDQPGLIWAAREANRGSLDHVALATQVVSVQDGFDVLTGLNRPDRWIELDDPNLQELWQVASGSYRYTLVDIGFFLEEPPPWQADNLSYRSVAAVSALQAAHHLVTVTRVDPIVLTRCVNQLVELKDRGLIPPEHTVILNRVQQSEKRYVRQAKELLSAYVSRDRIVVVNDDVPTFQRALLRCQTVPTFQPQAQVCAVFRKLAATTR